VDFGDPEREKGACDIDVDTIENLACVASVSVGLGFFVCSKHFSLFGRAKIGASANWEKGQEKGGKKTLACNPTILKNPYANERQSNQVLVNLSVTHINTTNCFSPAGKFRCSGLTLEDGCSVASNLRDFQEAFSFHRDCCLMEF